MKTALSFLLVVGAAAARADDHPQHHPAPTDAHRAGVDHRHDDATGVGHTASVHHFLLAEDGGTIRLETSDAADTTGRDRIRLHLQAIAHSFAAGDFSMPIRIHDQVPPGVAVLKALSARVRYRYSPTRQGGIVRISTKDPAARDAVREFLRFQISDHETGDPTE